MRAPENTPEPTSGRWQPMRAGIQNLWEYDDQRFVFHGGHLLLRGRNESGKTKAIEVLLPFLLDADLSPQRLDPFGTTARPMRWNLLNEGNADVNLAVGYVWLELGRRQGDTQRTLTLGAGLKAKRNTDGVESWYFITDQRIDDELSLFGAGRVPLTRNQLEEAIGDSGSVFGRGQDYRRAVNARLFELPDDQYQALLETLLQLRRPQLSKTLDPVGLSKILAVSLPPLDRTVLVPLADGFERLDAHRRTRATYIAAAAEVDRFLAVYRRYAGAWARARTRTLTQADSSYQNARAALRQCQTERQAAADRKSDLSERVEALRLEIEALDARIETLKSSDAYLGARELDEAERQARNASERLATAQRDVDLETTHAGRLEERCTAAATSLAAAEQLLTERLATAAQTAGEAQLTDEQAGLAAQIASAATEAAETMLHAIVAERRRRVETLEELVRQVRSAEAELMQAERRLQEAEERAATAQERLTTAERATEAAVQRYVASIDAWLQAAAIVDVADAERERLLSAEVDAIETLARELTAAARDRLQTERRLAETELAELERSVETVRNEQAALLEAEHRPPLPPSWRPERDVDRAGAPLYMLCDFAETDPARQAGIEAALEASGLLDAWVTPDGTVLGPDVFDLSLGAGARAGRSLTDLLVANEAGGVGKDVVEGILGNIELVDGADPAGDNWVSVDGRFRLGPLFGTSRKETPQYIGTTARERERQRRLDELGARIAQLAAQISIARDGRDAIRARLGQVEEAERRLPSLRPVLEARATVEAAHASLASEEQARLDATAGVGGAREILRQAIAGRDARAIRAGLSAWLERLPELRELTEAYRDAAGLVVGAARETTNERKKLAERQQDLDEAHGRLVRLEERLDAARSEATQSAARATALREAVGASAEQVLSEIDEGTRRRDAARRQQRATQHEHDAAATRLGEAGKAVAIAEERVAEQEDARRAGEQSVKELVDFGLLELFEIGDLGPASGWSYTETLLAARRLDGAIGPVEATQEAIDAAENKVSARQQELGHALPRELRLQAQRVAGFLHYRVMWSDRVLELLEACDALRAEVASRDRLMADEERELFESFLSGEAHAHLGGRLRRAHDLVHRMNEQIAERRTSSGMQIRLAWKLTPTAPAGAGEALDLMLRSGELLSDADRGALRTFLQQRLIEAKEDEAAGTFHERMFEVLDYRRWFAFTIESKANGGNWRPLTRKAHAAGSGGQKAVVLHLPLFAAAAAFYESAATHAPRLIVLDEAFAGIDRPTRGDLMGLLVEFDLDFVMTSYDEWGFYEQLTGLSTYHLAREPGVRGVLSEWFVWDGKQSVEMSAA